MLEFVVYFDGACEPRNPGGSMSWAWVVIEDGDEMVARSDYRAAAPGNTNNRAEYFGLGCAMKAASEIIPNGAEFTVRGDAQLVIRQMTGEYSCNAPGLIPLRHKIATSIREHGWKIAFEWVPREQNVRADALTRQEIESRGIKIPDRSKWKRR